MITYKKIVSLLELNKPKEIGMFKDRVSKFDTVDSRNTDWQGEANDLFGKFGFKSFGRGKYATVFGNPRYPYVIKLFMKDTAYLKYLNWVIRNQSNKYVPKIKGKVIKINDIFMAVRLEKLNNSSRASDEFIEMCRAPDDFLEGYSDFNSIPNNDKDAIDLCEFLSANERLIDVHGDNVMERNNKPVLIDPLYNWFKGGRFTMDPNDISNFKDIF